MKLTKEQIQQKTQLFDALCKAIEDCAAFALEIADEARSEFDEMSERRQEGEIGQRLQELVDAWEGFDGDDSLAVAFDELPTEA